MKLHFEANLSYQQEAIQSVCDLFEEDEKIYFVAETKDTGTPQVDLLKLKHDEQLKIKCGHAHFKSLDNIEYKVVNKASQLVG